MTGDYNMDLYNRIRRGDEFELIKVHSWVGRPDTERDYDQEINSPLHKTGLIGSNFAVEEKGCKEIEGSVDIYWMIGRNIFTGELYSFSLKNVNKYHFIGTNIERSISVRNYSDNKNKLLLC